ncbi:MAG: CNNM domain-containing protein [Planctomycetota bacterium]|jgi:CBS domain containing-hemolysin-like protein
MIAILCVFFGCLFALFVAGFYAELETASYASSAVRLELLARQGDERAVQFRWLMKDMAGLVTLTLIGHNMAVYSATFLIERYFSRNLQVTNGELWATLVLTPFCFIFAETTPKQLGIVLADAYCLAAARILRVSRFVFRPLALFLGVVAKLLSGCIRYLGHVPMQSSLRDEVLASIEIHTAEGLLNPTQRHLAHHILAAEETRLRSFLHPLSGVLLVKKAHSGEKALSEMRRQGSTFALVLDSHKKQVAGVVRIDDLVAVEDRGAATVGQIMQAPVKVEPQTSVIRACMRLQRNSMPIGIMMHDEQMMGVVYLRELLPVLIGQVER